VMGDVLQDPEKLLAETMAFYERILARNAGVINAESAHQMIERLRRIFKDYRDVLAAEDIEHHLGLGRPFAELCGRVAHVLEVRAVA